MTAVDVEDMTGDERGVVGSDVDNSVSHFLGQTETSQGYAFHQTRLVFRRTGKASQHARVRRPWADGIHSDAGLRHFECHRFGDPLYGMLRANVYGRKRRALMAIGRGDIDDAAAALTLHGQHLMLHAQHDAKHVGIEGGRKALGGLLRDRADLALGRRIVHGNVEVTEARDGLRDKVADIVFLTNIRPDVFSLRAERAQFIGERLARLVAAAGYDNFGALPRE